MVGIRRPGTFFLSLICTRVAFQPSTPASQRHQRAQSLTGLRRYCVTNGDPEQVSEDPACSQAGPACVSIIFAFLPLSSILRIRVVNRRLPDFSVSLSGPGLHTQYAFQDASTEDSGPLSSGCGRQEGVLPTQMNYWLSRCISIPDF